MEDEVVLFAVEVAQAGEDVQALLNVLRGALQRRGEIFVERISGRN